MKLHIHLLSYPNPIIGYGVHAINLAKELTALENQESLGIQITDLNDRQGLNNSLAVIQALPSDVRVVNVLLGDGRTSHEVLDQLPGKRVTYTVFESDVLPLGWRENLCRSDLVLTASEWGAEILRRELGNTPVAVVPEGVDPKIHHQWGRTTDERAWRRDAGEETSTAECFRFLTVGKFESRKGFKELVEAFQIAFANRMDVRLLLRLHNVFQPDYRESVASLITPKLRNRILIVDGDGGASQLTPEAMARLYRSSHCFVFPSKAEGWGLPLIEAISSGTPFIATHYSGQTEYLRHCKQSFSQIDYTLEEIKASDYLQYHRFRADRPAHWARPDVRSMASLMRQVVENWTAIREQASINARTIHLQFSWSAAAERLVDTLRAQFMQSSEFSTNEKNRHKGQDTPLTDSHALYTFLGKRAVTFQMAVAILNSQPTPRVLELGTTRSFRSGMIETVTYQADYRVWDWGAGCGTYVIPALVPDSHLDSVDPSGKALSVARRLCKPFEDRTSFNKAMSTDFLSSCEPGYAMIYMDHGETSTETAELHLRDAAIIIERSLLCPGGLILIDDQNIEEGKVGGKGSRSIPYFLEYGFTLLSPPGSYQALLQSPS